MKYIFFTILTIVIATACTPKQATLEESVNTSDQDSTFIDPFRALIDSEKLIGSILIFDQAENTFYSNDFDWAQKGQLPASTFKFPNSIIALELGIIKDSTTILPWNGEPQMNPNWEQDLKAKAAFQLSCVPCYRSIARQIGLDTMQLYMDAFNYGNMQIDTSNLDLFWLLGDSRINQFEQIDFLMTFYEKQLDIKNTTYSTMKYMLLREDTEAYQLYGKTGWSTDNDHDNTWFIGFLEVDHKIYYFATNLEPTAESNMQDLAKNRIVLTRKALEHITNITFK